MTDRIFTDPFSGDVLDNPTRKTYKVTYSVSGGGGRRTEYIDTLAEGRLTQAQARDKIAPAFAPPNKSDITIHSIKKTDEDAAGAPPGPF